MHTPLPRAGFVPRALRDAIKQAQRRRVVDIASFNSMRDANRDKAFSVAGDLNRQSIRTILTASTSAIERGIPYNQWVKTLPGGFLERIVAPETVFVNAASTTYQKSRFTQQQKLKALRPFLRYLTFGDDRVRPNHAAMNGTVSPQDSGFWENNYPPNGHNCRCTAQAITRGQVRRNDETVLKSQAQVDDSVSRQQKASGQKQARPIADKGWRTAPEPTNTGIEQSIEAFKSFPRGKWESILIARRLTISKIQTLKKPVTKIKPDADGFKNARTIEEAQEKAKTFLASDVDYDRIEVEMVNRINKQSELLFKKYALTRLKIATPKTRGKGVWASVSSGRISEKPIEIHFDKGKFFNGKKIKDKVRYITNKPGSSYYDSIRRSLKINEDNIKIQTNEAAIRELTKISDDLRRVLSFKQTNYLVAGKEIESVVTHEVGHVFHGQNFGQMKRTFSTVKTGKFTRDQQLKIKKRWSQLAIEFKKENRNFNLSSYAEYNNNEFFAENFSMFHMEPKKLQPEIKEFMDAVLSGKVPKGL